MSEGGSAIDEEALAESLIAGKLAGAALDVFCKEPLPKESPLWGIDNLIITPYVAEPSNTVPIMSDCQNIHYDSSDFEKKNDVIKAMI